MGWMKEGMRWDRISHRRFIEKVCEESAHKVALHIGGQRHLEGLQPVDVEGQAVLAVLVLVQLGVVDAAAANHRKGTWSGKVMHGSR